MSGNNQPVVCAGFKLGNSEQARSIGYQEELSPTLNAECGGNKPAVVASAVALDMTHACDVIRECGEQVPALQARMGTGVMDQANKMADEILTQVNRVKELLFAERNSDEDREPPRCFREAVRLQVSTLSKIETELGEIMQALGV